MVHPFFKIYTIHTLSYAFNFLNFIFPRKSYVFKTFAAKIGQDWTHFIKKQKNLFFSLYI